MSGVALSRRVEAIGLGRFIVTNDPNDELVCLGIGSCVALCIYDPGKGVAGMAHLVLPDSSEGRGTGRGAKFVDTGIPLLVAEMEALGGSRTRMVVKMAGGAHMIVVAQGNGSSVGDRNVTAARQSVVALGLAISAEEVGGSRGRTVRILADSGRVLVASAGAEPREL
ncbi:MAG: chemotaxis protein CheD [Chloroflexi bacterium]|nr:chemotaxis protein CheD [Chloroflexota bacterium]